MEGRHGPLKPKVKKRPDKNYLYRASKTEGKKNYVLYLLKKKNPKSQGDIFAWHVFLPDIMTGWCNCWWELEKRNKMSDILQSQGRCTQQSIMPQSHQIFKYTSKNTYWWKISFSEIHLLCKTGKNCSLLQNFKRWVHHYRKLFYQQQCHSWDLNQQYNISVSVDICRWHIHMILLICINIILPLFQNVKENWSALYSNNSSHIFLNATLFVISGLQASGYFIVSSSIF